jgi:hypothetical protein
MDSWHEGSTNSQVGLAKVTTHTTIGARIRDIVMGALSGQLREAALHHLEGSKYVRGAFALAAAKAEGVIDADAWCIALACELLHNASLIHDDIIDQDEIRRTRPAVWLRYGVTTATLLGDGFIGLAFRQIAQLSSAAAAADLFKLFADTLVTMVRGEANEAASLIGTSLSREESFAVYRGICTEKTAPLFELALVASLSNVSRLEADIRIGRTIMRHIGFAYQLLDDAKDGDYHLAGVLHDIDGRAYLIESARQQCRMALELAIERKLIPSLAVAAALANELLAECNQIGLHLENSFNIARAARRIDSQSDP